MPSLKEFAAKIFAKYAFWTTKKWSTNPVESQKKVFSDLIEKANKTEFGRDHNFEGIKSHGDFIEQVPIRDYEGLRDYIEKAVNGKGNVLWPGKPLYFASTSGTTSGVKNIPITKDSMPSHIEAARNAILSYINDSGNTKFVNGKMIFLQGSPELKEKNGIKFGRLSGIVAHYVPSYLQKNRMPTWETNCISDWESKVDAIVTETLKEDMSVISGIPSWVQMYFEKIIERTGKPVGEVFPNFNLFIYGGVNYEPYRAKFESLLGRKVDSIELYPASEGFFAYQDEQGRKDMLLLLDSGMFYEFVKADEFFDESPPRITIEDVELNVNYVLIVSSNAGLWAYNVGDTIMFTSKDPYRVIVTGRIKHFISAFGEHVIGKEVDMAMQEACNHYNAQISEFTVAPQINPESGLPYHEWLVEFEKEPKDLNEFSRFMDLALQEQNKYYYDLIVGKILRPLKITKVKKNGFKEYMEAIGKLDAQNKVPRLTNDRKIASHFEEKQLTY